MSYVVTGATGQVGSAVVDYLISKSVPVRVLIRSESKAESFKSRNIEVIIGDLCNQKALREAFENAKAVFAMSPPTYTSPDMMAAAKEVAQNLSSAIKAAKIERVVVLSSVGSERSSKTGNILTTHILENELKDAAPQVVFVRCAWFMENWSSAISAYKSGHSPVIGSLLQKLDRKIPQVATKDIGRTVAEYMMKSNNEMNECLIIELEGPEPYSPNDVAKVTSELLGRQVVAAPMTEEIIRNTFGKFGWSKSVIDSWIEMVNSFDDNTICWATNQNTLRIQGITSLTDVIKEELK